ncbi:MAG TPA: hypothetical protein VNA20_03260 [Frankiaceae bacterium]|nr:hypothetical protein [Frankiaceae bacterium]
MRRLLLTLSALVLLPVTAIATEAAAPPAPTLRAGAAVVDDTWNVGSGAGQYGGTGSPVANAVAGGETDPHLHSTKKVSSYGVQSRLTSRAIVVEGANGKRVALVKTDNYLAQDLLLRRVAQLLDEADSGVTYDSILYAASHNHSSPYYATPAAGVWLFQDAADLRAFERQARAMAAAITTAEARLEPALMGATTVPFDIYKGNVVGPQRADDGTPSGYPDDEGDDGLVVMSFVREIDRSPIATWLNWGQHPESLDSYDLISADFLGPLERYVDRETGAPLVFSQGDVGSAEGPYFRANYETLPDGVVRAWAHVGYAQTERGARYVADAVHAGLDALKAGGGDVPYSADVPVDAYDRWTPGPVSHPYPSVSNCRTQPTLDGDPGAPVLGMPDCQRGGAPTAGLAPIAENLRAHGIPVPDNYDAPSAGAVEENVRIRLQTIRIGEVVLASCSCEAQVDLIKNFESRADQVQGNIYDGYDWAGQCTPNADSSWTCPDAPSRGTRTVNVSDAQYRRMAAQIHNDARGWDEPANALDAMSEPTDPAAIYGNFTKEELPAERGYKIAVGVGHAGDYTGYTVSYREYQARDSYRKALTSYGPHTADYMVTRLVRMAGALKGGAAPADEPTHAIGLADEQRQAALAVALGQASKAAYDTYEAALSDDVGPAAVVTPAKSINRFDGTFVTWRGGSNAVDQPRVRVDRRVGDTWVPYGDQTGEVPVQLALPRGVRGLADARTGTQEWIWTAAFEAYNGFPARLGSTPPGEYRFVIDGAIRSGRTNTPYHLESTFEVRPWDGVVARDLRVEDDGRLSFVVDPVVYPRTYASPFRFIRDDGNAVLCKTCTFRPWAKDASIAAASLTVIRDHGASRVVPAVYENGRWYATTELVKGEQAVVTSGDVRDSYGETNGDPSNTVHGPPRKPAPAGSRNAG